MARKKSLLQLYLPLGLAHSGVERLTNLCSFRSRPGQQPATPEVLAGACLETPGQAVQQLFPAGVRPVDAAQRLDRFDSLGQQAIVFGKGGGSGLQVQGWIEELSRVGAEAAVGQPETLRRRADQASPRGIDNEQMRSLRVPQQQVVLAAGRTSAHPAPVRRDRSIKQSIGLGIADDGSPGLGRELVQTISRVPGGARQGRETHRTAGRQVDVAAPGCAGPGLPGTVGWQIPGRTLVGSTQDAPAAVPVVQDQQAMLVAVTDHKFTWSAGCAVGHVEQGTAGTIAAEPIDRLQGLVEKGNLAGVCIADQDAVANDSQAGRPEVAVLAPAAPTPAGLQVAGQIESADAAILQAADHHEVRPEGDPVGLANRFRPGQFAAPVEHPETMAVVVGHADQLAVRRDRHVLRRNHAGLSVAMDQFQPGAGPAHFQHVVAVVVGHQHAIVSRQSADSCRFPGVRCRLRLKGADFSSPDIDFLQEIVVAAEIQVILPWLAQTGVESRLGERRMRQSSAGRSGLGVNVSWGTPSAVRVRPNRASADAFRGKQRWTTTASTPEMSSTNTSHPGKAKATEKALALSNLQPSSCLAVLSAFLIESEGSGQDEEDTATRR